MSTISSIYANKVIVAEIPFDKFSQKLVGDGHQYRRNKNQDVQLFNLVKYNGNGRKKGNATHVSGIVLDYDGDLTLEEIGEWHHGWEYILYSSHRHLHDSDTVKVKVVMPFDEPLPIAEWIKRSEGSKKYFQGADQSSLRESQFQALPNCPESRAEDAFITHIQGERFNPRLIPIIIDNNKISSGSVFPTTGIIAAKGKISNTLSLNTMIRTKSGDNIRAGDITTHIRDVYCCSHRDKLPGAFCDINSKGTPYLVCPSQCGTIWFENESSPSIHNHFTTIRNKTEELPQILEPLKWEKLLKILKKIAKNLTKNNLVYGFEGTGKSYLSTILDQQKKRKIIFGCATNKQAIEKSESLSKLGMNVTLLTSKSFEIEKKFGVKPVLYPRKHPWDIGRIDAAETARAINDANPDIEPVLPEQLQSGFQPSAIDWDMYDVVVTTHARIGHLGRLNARCVSHGREPIIPIDVVIFYDDPVLNDFFPIAPFPGQMTKKTLYGAPIIKHQTIKDSRTFFKTPAPVTVGYGFESHTTIYTTTELLITELISQQHPDITVHDNLLPANSKLDGPDIHLLSTKLVRSKIDGICPPIMERIRRLGFSFEYIANAQGCEFNLSNNKGMNQFSDSSTVIELSIPPKDETLLIFENLGGEVAERTINLAIMLDKLHQSVGRNQGYRHKGHQCVVLTDPQYFNDIVKHSRYAFNSVLKADADDPVTFPRNKKDFSELVDAVSWHINRYDHYIGDGQKFKNDCIKSLKGLPFARRVSRQKRINTAVTNLMKLHPSQAERLAEIPPKLISSG